eukprot:TRINITY_DN3826_c0_g1_i2.p1 TRINITY_DN3826_c0_g1~~TRINITY_DN3826_c0_g1_i2.p1  ORF type:complete len:213 (+),score=37.18 TRINITY_DN3826_c0_g1_i2:36-674(+)
MDAVVLTAAVQVSNAAIGRTFEVCTVAALARLGIGLERLERVGGAYDEGVDFQGLWRLPVNPVRDLAALQRVQQVWVLGQCKRLRRAVGSAHVRSLDGVLHHHPQRSAGVPSLGLLVASAQAGFSPAAVTFFHHPNTCAMGLATLDDVSPTPVLLSLRLNEKAAALLPFLKIGTVYDPDAQNRRRVSLRWHSEGEGRSTALDLLATGTAARA